MGSENQVLMVLANYNFNDDEYEYTRKTLDDNSIGVKIVAGDPGECTSVTGKNIDVDMSFQSVISDDFRAIIFIGGPGVDLYFTDSDVLSLAQKFFKENKIVAAICWAPVILARAGLLAQRKATVWEGAKDDLIASGVIYTGDKVTVDGTLITADGPDSAVDFGQTVVNMLNSKDNQQIVARLPGEPFFDSIA